MVVMITDIDLLLPIIRTRGVLFSVVDTENEKILFQIPLQTYPDTLEKFQFSQLN